MNTTNTTDSGIGTIKEIASRTKTGVYDEYEMKETLCTNDAGQFFLNRQFTGHYDEVNAVRCDWVHKHQNEEITAEEADKWLKKNKAPIMTDSERGVFPEGSNGLYFGRVSSDALPEYDGSWFKPLLEKHASTAHHIYVEAGLCIYNECGNFWETMSDVLGIGFVKVEPQMTTSALCDAVSAELQNYRKLCCFSEPTVYIEKVTVYDSERTELGSAVNNPLPEAYAKMAETIEDFDMLSWH